MCNLQEYLKGLTPALDRRLKKRVTPTSPVYVMFGDTGGSVVNVSETGMAIAVAVGNLPAVGDYPMRICLQLPMSSQNVEVSARIVWLRESRKVFGVRLVDCTADTRAGVSNWIASEKLATEFEQPAQLLTRNRNPLDIGSSGNPSARNGEAAAHYADLFPSENNYAKKIIPVDENKPQQCSLPATVRSNTGSNDLILRAPSKISTATLPRMASLPQVQTASESSAPRPTNAPIAGFGWQAPTDEGKSSADNAMDSASHPYIFDLSGLHVAALVFLFAVVGIIIGIAATKASVDVLASLGRGPFGKHVWHSQSRPSEPPSGLRSDSVSSVFPTETPSAQTSRSSVDLDRSIGANTVGSFRPLEEKANRVALDSEVAARAHSRDTNSSISTTVEHNPSADSERRLNRNDLKRLFARSESPRATTEHAHSTVAVGPIRSTRINRALLIAKPATSTVRAASPKRPHLAEAVGPKGTGPGNPVSESAKFAAAAASRPPASPKPKYPAIARSSLGSSPRNPSPPIVKPAAHTVPNPLPPVSSEVVPPVMADGSSSASPRNPVPPAAAQPSPSPPANLVTLPSKGSKPLKLVFPQRQIVASSSLMITTQLSVVVPPKSGLVAAQASQLQAGKLVSYVLPRNPRPGDQYGTEETVRVHATIGQQGLVTDIKPLSGPIFLLSSTMGAVHLWRYKPTLLNGTPIETHQDVTVIFKLPR